MSNPPSTRRELTLARIAASAEQVPNRPALCTQGETYTYAELVAAARGIQAAVMTERDTRGARIGVVTGDDFLTYASLLAIWSANAVYVPLNVHNPADRNCQIAKDAGLSQVVTSRPRDEWPNHLPTDFGDVRIVETSSVELDNGPLVVPDTDPDELAYVLFTSGSTGKPKGVPITHANISQFMTTLTDDLGYEFVADDRFLQMFELTFDLSVMATFAPWCVGASTYVVPEKGVSYMNVLDLLMKQGITVALMVPSILPYLQRFFDEVCLPELRLSMFCGEALMHDIVVEWSKCVPNAKIENVYGPTEATIFCTNYHWQHDRSAQELANGIVPIGRAIKGMTTVVVDSKGSACSDGEKGELCLIGGQVMSGYWKNEGKTRQAFKEVEIAGQRYRAYLTGDISFVNEHGNLVYCGRKDSQVKIDGHRIELGEIEHYARSFIGSSKAAVLVKNDVAGQGYLELFVSGQDLGRDRLVEFLRSKLPEYMVPKQLYVLDDLPLNLNGKIDRTKLSNLDLA